MFSETALALNSFFYGNLVKSQIYGIFVTQICKEHYSKNVCIMNFINGQFKRLINRRPPIDLLMCVIVEVDSKSYKTKLSLSAYDNGAASVVVSCKIPILATRVRFPGGAVMFYTHVK